MEEIGEDGTLRSTLVCKGNVPFPSVRTHTMLVLLHCGFQLLTQQKASHESFYAKPAVHAQHSACFPRLLAGPNLHSVASTFHRCLHLLRLQSPPSFLWGRCEDVLVSHRWCPLNISAEASLASNNLCQSHWPGFNQRLSISFAIRLNANVNLFSWQTQFGKFSSHSNELTKLCLWRKNNKTFFIHVNASRHLFVCQH